MRQVCVFQSMRQEHKHESTDQIVTAEFLRAAGNSAEVAEAAAIAAWKHAAGDGLKEHAVPLKLENRTLTIAVADAIWQKQLTLDARATALSSKFDPRPTTRRRVRFRRRSEAREAARGAAAQQEEPLDNEVPLELWSAANAIQDKELRKSFLKTALLSLRHKDKRCRSTIRHRKGRATGASGTGRGRAKNLRPTDRGDCQLRRTTQ